MMKFIKFIGEYTMATKTKCQIKHAKRRAAERYDLELTEQDLHKLIRSIQSGEGQLIRRQSHRVSIWSVICQTKECVVVYDKMRKNIASFLPLEAKYEDIFAEVEE